MCVRGPNCLVVGLNDIMNSITVIYNYIWYIVRVTFNMILKLSRRFAIYLCISTFGCSYTTCSIILECASWLVFFSCASWSLCSHATWSVSKCASSFVFWIVPFGPSWVMLLGDACQRILHAWFYVFHWNTQYVRAFEHRIPRSYQLCCWDLTLHFSDLMLYKAFRILVGARHIWNVREWDSTF